MAAVVAIAVVITVATAAVAVLQGRHLHLTWRSGPVIHAHNLPGSNRFHAEVLKSYQLGVDWLIRNVKENGLFVYLYDGSLGIELSGNNPVRQLMASRLLAEISQERPSLRALHRKNLATILSQWYREDASGRGYILFEGSSKLGANAMALRTLVASPFFDAHEDIARRLAHGVLSLMRPDGSFRAWFIEPSYEYDEDYLLTYYSGEAILSLVEYAVRTSNPAYQQHAARAATYYVDQYVDRISENYFPAYVPWHIMALDALHQQDSQPEYVDAIFRLADTLLVLQDRRAFPGRFFNPEFPQFGAPHSSSDGVYTEGFVHAYGLAHQVGDEEREQRYAEAIGLAVRNLTSLQFNPSAAGDRLRGNRLLGAIRIRSGSGVTQVDATQHAMDAFRKILALASMPR